MTKPVSIIKVEDGRDNVKKKVYDAVRIAMENANWKDHILPYEKTLLKVNMCWADFLLPGMCTSPWMLGAVIETIQDHVGEIIVGEGMASAFQNFEVGCRNNRWDKTCKEYGVKLIDLAKDEYIQIDATDLEVPFPITLSKLTVDIPNLISLPMMKTHSVTTFTGALKNQFGISFGKRITYHLNLAPVIVAINRAVKANFVVMDATIGMEGNGPANGIPKEKDLILASADLVGLDATACMIMNIDPESIEYIKLANKIGLGTIDPEIVSNIKMTDIKENFICAKPQGYYEKGMLPLLKNKFLKDIVYNYFWIPGRFGVKCVRNFWYYREGSKYAEKILDNSRYAEQWK